jgi:hypothetical protein
LSSYDLFLALILPLYVISCVLLRLTARDGSSSALDAAEARRNSVIGSDQLIWENAVCFEAFTVIMGVNFVLGFVTIYYVSSACQSSLHQAVTRCSSAGITLVDVLTR